VKTASVEAGGFVYLGVVYWVTYNHYAGVKLS